MLTMDVRGRIVTGTVLLAGVMAAGMFGMMIHKEELSEGSRCYT